MGSRVSIEECTSTDNPRVRDCCHLEGETPIEIRIAYQHPRPSAQPAGFDPAVLRAHQASAFGVAGASYRRGGAAGSGPWPPGSADAEKPPMPRGAERLRLPPPSGSARGPPRTAANEDAGGDFDADTFAAPPDSERSEVSATPGRMHEPVALQVLQLAEDGFFPEVVRANRTHTFREASSTHRDSPDGEPAAASREHGVALSPASARRAGGAEGASAAASTTSPDLEAV